jgi:homoserine kinase
VVEVAPSVSSQGRSTLTILGPFAAVLPKNPADNLVWRCLRLFTQELRQAHRDRAPVALTLHKNLPLCSGLGSSASSVVATLVALNAYFGEPCSAGTLLELAGTAEGFVSGEVHYDDVAPALLGGLRLIGHGDRCDPQPLPFFKNFVLAVVHPALSLSTAQARTILPKSIPMGLSTAFAGNLACLVHSLHVRDRALFKECLRDLVVEPHRRRLVKGFIDVQRAAFGQGALGCSLSGSGPSVVAVAASKTQAKKIMQAMITGFASRKVAATGKLCRIDARGARLL